MRSEALGRRLRRELALHDWLLAGYFGLLLLALAAAGPDPRRVATLAAVGAAAGLAAACVGVVRARRRPAGPLAAWLYRLGLVGSFVGSYFLLRQVLPIVNDASYDHALRAIDVALFGTDPVLWLDRFVTPAITEWFAFCYSCHFLLLGAYVLPMLASRRALLQDELGLGVLGIFVVGHVLYMVVPGFGPYRAFGDVFPTPLPRGPWMTLVADSVRTSGALKDIFPSLHTAAAAYLVAFAFRHRRVRPFGAVWPVTAIVALNIVIGAVFLRWHYVIDVIAGAALAAVAAVVAPRLAGWELRRRVRVGAGPIWPALDSGADTVG